MKPIEEVAGIVSRAQRFCASIPAGDERQKDAEVVNVMCDTIFCALKVRVTPGSHEAEQMITLLRLMLSKLEYYLSLMDARALAMDLKRWEGQQREYASRPRKNITKDELLAYRDARPRRGWKKAACLHFGITLKTLNNKVE